MKKKGYESAVLPLRTLMLTGWHIEMRVAWAQAHLQDNWDRTVFTDETTFDLFRNKVRRRQKTFTEIVSKSNGLGWLFAKG